MSEPNHDGQRMEITYVAVIFGKKALTVEKRGYCTPSSALPIRSFFQGTMTMPLE
jgi:hypothetical protein